MRKERGISLLEIIISLHLIAIMIVSVMLFTTYISSYVKAGKNIAGATSIAQKQIELLKTYTPEELSTTPNLEEKIIYTDGIEYWEFTRSTIISPYRTYLFRVSVGVKWVEKNALKETMLETYMDRP